MYNINELVNILNKRVSLDNFNSIDDKRKSSVWTVRLIREYFSKHNIKGIKKGKNVFYTDQNIEDIKNILILKSATSSSYKAVSGATARSVSSLYAGNNEGEPLKSILDRTSTLINDSSSYSKSENYKLLSLNEIENKVIKINENVQISYSVSNETLVHDLKKWLKNIGEKI